MGEVVSTLDNKKRREVLFFRINAFNYYSLFLIIRFKGFAFTLLINVHNYY